MIHAVKKRTYNPEQLKSFERMSHLVILVTVCTVVLVSPSLVLWNSVSGYVGIVFLDNFCWDSVSGYACILFTISTRVSDARLENTVLGLSSISSMVYPQNLWYPCQ